jgi:methionyl-tRNA synthetase
LTDRKLQQIVSEKCGLDETPEDDLMITIEDLKQLELVIARVAEAERIPKTDKLLKLEVDTGDETRTIVAGIAEHYSVEEIIGKNIVLLANLQPVHIRGVESRGMLMAAIDAHDGNVVLLTPDRDVAPGSKIS